MVLVPVPLEPHRQELLLRMGMATALLVLPHMAMALLVFLHMATALLEFQRTEMLLLVLPLIPWRLVY